MAAPALPPLPANYVRALELIDAAHSEDPNTVATGDGDGDGGTTTMPYELHYARKMTRFLALHSPEASPELQVACRAQHFRRWQISRSAYPSTRAGYLTWRARQKTQAAMHVSALLSSSSLSSRTDPEAGRPLLPADSVSRIAALVRKERLGTAGADRPSEPVDPEAARRAREVQALEDVACLVFLEDQFDRWFFAADDADRGAAVGGTGVDVDEAKMVGILRKTWLKMGERGRELALGLPLSDRAKELVVKALSADDAKEDSVIAATG